MRRAFDFVTWDPRGLGQSKPALADCSVAMPQRPATGPVDWQRLLMQRQRELAESNRDCITRDRALIPQMGTIEVVHDLDALRQQWAMTASIIGGSPTEPRSAPTIDAVFPGGFALRLSMEMSIPGLVWAVCATPPLHPMTRFGFSCSCIPS